MLNKEGLRLGLICVTKELNYMNYLLLIAAIFVLLFALRKISLIKYSKRHTAIKEAKQNVVSLLWGVLVVSAINFIPYQVWV